MKKFLLIAITILIGAVLCFAQVYEEARTNGIKFFNQGNYSSAVREFTAAQFIAPVNNDLSEWIIKCNNAIVSARNKQVVARKSRVTTSSQTNNLTLPVGAQYDSIGHYGSCGLALVRYKDKYGFIDKNKKLVVPIKYDDVYSYIPAIEGTLTDRVLKDWNAKWNWSWDKGQLMSVCRDGKWGYINEIGQEVIPVKYDDVRENIVFKNRPLIGVGLNGKYGFVDWTGKEVIPLQYDIVSRFYCGVFETNVGKDMVPVVKNGKLGFIDEIGTIVIPFEFEPIYDADYSTPSLRRPVWFDGLTYVKKGTKWGLIDAAGQSVTGFKYDDKAEIELINVNGDYKSYFVFPTESGKAFYFDGREYKSEREFNQAITRRAVSSSASENNFQIKIVDTDAQTKDPDYAKLQLMKQEIDKIQNSYVIKDFHHFSNGVAVIELKTGICLFSPDCASKYLEGVTIHWPYYNDGLLGCCYNTQNSSDISDGFYLDSHGKMAFNEIILPNGNATVIGSRYGKQICAGPFSNRYAKAWHYKGDNPKYGMIDSTGNLVVPCEYKSVRRVANGYVVEKGDNVVFLNDQLSTIAKLKNSTISDASNNEFIIHLYGEGYRRYTGAFVCIESSNNELYLPNDDNLHLVSAYGKGYGYCNNSGDIIIPQQYTKAKSFSDGLAPVCIDDRYGYINVEGDLVIDNMFEDAGLFNDGLAWVKKDGYYYYIDITGKLVNDEKYTYADDFHEGFAIIRIGNRYGIIAKSGLSTFQLI